MPAQTDSPQVVSRPQIDTRPRALLIAGEPVPAADGATFDTVDPAVGTVITQVAKAGPEDVDRAVDAARAALAGPWAGFNPDQRQRVLLRLAELVVEHGEELALLDVIDVGRTVAAARYLIADAAELLRWYAAKARTVRGQTIENSRRGELLTFTVREPVGVVGAITPWNAPLTMAIWKIGPALAAGCTVVHKPAEQSPLSALRFAELALEAGLPPGVLNVVQGDGGTGAALTEHPGVDKISFTGSVATARHIVRASAGSMKRLTMELGGKSPNIVFADADLALAVPAAGAAIFTGSGQICAAGSRLYVHRSVYDEVVAGVAEYGRGLRIGDPALATTQFGPLASREQLDRVLGYLDVGRAEGAEVVSGGARLTEDGLGEGFYVPPTVFAGVDPAMRIVREEIFGPVVVATPFETEDEVVALANATDYGLAAGLWTRDLGTAMRMTRRLKAGNVWVNTWGVTDPAVPMGGFKLSGYGKDLGDEQLDAYLETKAVALKG